MIYRIDVRGLYGAFADAAHAAGMSPTKAGKILDIDPATMSRIKHGHIRDMYASRLLAICQWSRIDPLQFLIEDAPAAGGGTS